MILNTNGITVRQLKEFLKDWPETTKSGEDSEVWILTGEMTSNVCVEVSKLNDSDIMMRPNGLDT